MAAEVRKFRTKEKKTFNRAPLVLAGLAIFVFISLFIAGFMGRNLAVHGSVFGPPNEGGRVNILLVGIDDGDLADPKNSPHRSDSMLLVGVHKATGSVSVLSIPRDTRVVIPGHGNTPDKFGHSYAYGGVALTMATVESFLKVPVHYYAVADWQGFIRVVDALGGVDMVVDADMKYEDPYANLKINLKKGYQHLNGEQSGQYVRFRMDEMGDIGRVARQQKFLKALASQAISPSNILKLPYVAYIVGQSVSTNMTPWAFLQVSVALPAFRNNQIQSDMVPGNFANIGGVSYWGPDQAELRKVVQRMFLSTPSQAAKQTESK